MYNPTSEIAKDILDDVAALVEKYYKRGEDGTDIEPALRVAVSHVFRNEIRLESDEANRV